MGGWGLSWCLSNIFAMFFFFHWKHIAKEILIKVQAKIVVKLSFHCYPEVCCIFFLLNLALKGFSFNFFCEAVSPSLSCMASSSLTFVYFPAVVIEHSLKARILLYLCIDLLVSASFLIVAWSV